MTLELSPENVGEAAEKLGISMVKCEASHAEATMPVGGNRQPFGLLHGGASALLAEHVASFAAIDWAKRHGKIAVGATMTVNHLRSVSSGTVRCAATAQHLGRNTAIYSFQITTENTGELICFGSVGCQLLPSRPAVQ